MAERPEPPIPAYIDMAGNDWFPLHHQKLTDSVWWRTASHMARSCHVDLLIAAYREVPAASLADDDRVLAVACGMHRDMEAFRALKAELMESWRLCSDGRWYQPFLASICLETWEARDQKRQRDRARKAARRAEIAADLAPVTEASARTHPAVRTEKATEEKTGQDTTRQDTTSPGVRAAPKPGGGWSEDRLFADAWDACTRKMRMRSKSREQTWQIWKRTAARPGPEALLAALRAYLRKDADVERTGGPGFSRWLADGVWEHWLARGDAETPVPDPLDDWRRRVLEFTVNGYWPGDEGPRPGKAGCRCPPEVLAAFGFGVVD